MGFNYKDSLEGFDNEPKNIKYVDTTAEDRSFDPKNIHEGINELPDDVDVLCYGPPLRV